MSPGTPRSAARPASARLRVVRDRGPSGDPDRDPDPDRRRRPPATGPQVVVVDRRPQATDLRERVRRQVRARTVSMRQLDLPLLIAALSLSLLGAALVWSATRGRLLASGDNPQAFLTKHVLNLMLGVALGWVVTRIDYRRLRALTPVLYGLVIVVLLVVLTPLGTSINGAHAWIQLPAGFTLQPGEFAKIAVILAMATVLADRGIGKEVPGDRDVRQALVWAAGPVLLIMLEPDLGTVLVIGSIVIGIIAMSGARSRWVAGLLVAVVAAAGLAIALGVLDQYQLDRLTAFADPSADPRGVGYNTQQARIAIGGGGLIGTGLFNGPQTQGAFVPYQQTDFVFSAAGEELGLLGAGLLILLVGVVLWRGIRIARESTDVFGRLVAIGVVCWFAFQAFENIGMNLGIMPVTGVPLPFVSYGGTSMFAAWIGIGLLQSVRMRSRNASG